MSQSMDRKTGSYIRQFDHNVPMYLHDQAPAEMEDRELTAYLERELDDLLSLSETPPVCPHCNQNDVVLAMRAAKPKPALPVFRCLSCDVHFRRTTGTPLHGLKVHNSWFGEFLKLLSQQRTLACAAETLNTKAVTVKRYTERLRQWLLQLDPTGYYESRVRLGMEIRPDVHCPYCHRTNVLRYRGFSSDNGERRCVCDSCNRWVRLDSYLAEQEDKFILEHRVNVRPPSHRRKSATTD